MNARIALLAALAAIASSCRDEQAGPPLKAGQGAPAAPVLHALDRAPADLTHRSGATFGGGNIIYIGSRVEPPNARPGQTVRVTHYFSALAPPPQGFQLFAHLVDADSGQMLLNADHEPQNGAAPLGLWPVGKVIDDEHTLALPPHSGRLRLLLGFWQGDRRLSVDDPSAHDGSNRVLGPIIGGELPLPEYRAPRAAKAPAIDGIADEPAWQKAPEVELVGSYDGRRPQLRTTARILWDDAHLYVAFDCEDPDAWGTLTAHDDAIYNEEVVEVFLDANADGKSYNELQVSPNNVTFDASFVARRSDLKAAMAWESGMKTAVKVRGTANDPSDRDQGWSAEMQIPLSSLTEVPHPPRPGDRWRFNLYRLEHLQRLRQVEGQAFSPLFAGDFHHLPRFGWLLFE
ncbi:MAG: carbohydrate-binding family 9-like protein [Myxococcales bacterium]|nr:carbohydrate-binding family 9-like protein [Myxococcales bacterium]